MTYKHEARRPDNVWVVVSDRARARIFTASWPELDEWEEVHTLIHPQSEAHARDVVTDGPGRFRGADGRRQSGDDETDFRHQTATVFARQVAQCLEKGRQRNKFGRLMLVAPALFLGVLRDSLPPPLAQVVAVEVDKELTQLRAAEIAERARDLIPESERAGKQ